MQIQHQDLGSSKLKLSANTKSKSHTLSSIKTSLQFQVSYLKIWTSVLIMWTVFQAPCQCLLQAPAENSTSGTFTTRCQEEPTLSFLISKLQIFSGSTFISKVIFLEILIQILIHSSDCHKSYDTVTDCAEDSLLFSTKF